MAPSATSAADKSFTGDGAVVSYLEHDPEKVGTGFPKRSCSNKKIERDDDSKKSHHALSGTVGCPLIPIRAIDAIQLAQQRRPGEIAIAVRLVCARPHLVKGLFQDVAGGDRQLG